MKRKSISIFLALLLCVFTSGSDADENPPVDTPPDPKDLKLILATPEQQKLCPAGMVYIPAGWFQMGCDPSADKYCMHDEEPIHMVYLDAYCIDKHEFPNNKLGMPMASVIWDRADMFCGKKKKRLPTEAEWEKAARGVDGRIYPWGNEVGKDIKPAKFFTNGVFYTKSGIHLWDISPYGIHDMANNLIEWTSDWYDEKYYVNSPSHNPQEPEKGEKRVARGVLLPISRKQLTKFLRITMRSGFKEAKVFSQGMGFRCVADIK